MTRFYDSRFYDSWSHYRYCVRCGCFEAVWRAFAYEILHWPDGLRSAKWMELKMTEYQTGTTKVEATQWFKNGDHPLDKSYEITVNGETFLSEGEVVRRFRDPDWVGTESCDLCGHLMHIHGWIDGPGEGHTVCPSDFVVTTEEGEVYSCPAGIFATTYNIEVP